MPPSPQVRTGPQAGDAAETFASQLIARDRARFVGRARELLFLERCLSGERRENVIFISGHGGVGKSTLLRELLRRATAAGWETFTLDGRDLESEPDRLETELRRAHASPRPLVVIDSYEYMRALDGTLRRSLLPALPESAVVVIAGRTRPDAAWSSGIWEGATAELELRPFSRAEAAELLDAYGVEAGRVPVIAGWARGSPLALTLAAQEAPGAGEESERAAGPEAPELLAALTRRLLGSEMSSGRPMSLAVAAIARASTPELLAAALPGVDAVGQYTRLLELTFAEELASGVVLHDLVKRGLLSELKRTDPERERTLRRRIVDYHYGRGRDGDQLAILEMSHLVQDPAIKWGFGWDGTADHRVDTVRELDLETAGRLCAEWGGEEWWTLQRPFFERSPASVAVARDREDALIGYSISVGLDSAPAFAERDPLMGPYLGHARGCITEGESVLWHTAIAPSDERRAQVQATLGVAGVLRAGVSNPRFAYLPITPDYPGAVEFARALNAERIPSLDVELDGRVVECHRVDYGSRGLIGALRAVVYIEMGLAAPGRETRAEIDLETVREALRNYHVPAELTHSPLARGTSLTERVESVRSLLLDACDRAFGDSEAELLLKRTLELGYLHPRGHAAAAHELSLSRASYFRRLRRASERVSEYIVSA